uniref:Putative 2-oxoglutarate-dependent dioxygenase At3g49630 n=1 Tax=Rhizophora mucronata TaxID=61149 RepID=A0A2P2JHU6_RHIMU
MSCWWKQKQSQVGKQQKPP